MQEGFGHRLDPIAGSARTGAMHGFVGAIGSPTSAERSCSSNGASSSAGTRCARASYASWKSGLSLRNYHPARSAAPCHGATGFPAGRCQLSRRRHRQSSGIPRNRERLRNVVSCSPYRDD